MGRGQIRKNWKPEIQKQALLPEIFSQKNLTAIGTLGGELIVESFSGETLINKKVMEKAVADIDISSSEKIIVICSGFGDILAFELR